jgi:triosephosphate isomerase
VARVAEGCAGLRQGSLELFVLPTFPCLPDAVRALGRLGVDVGAQDLCWEDRGPYTGEVSGVELAEIGCRYVEIGHMERRKHLGEDDAMVSAKTAAAFRNGLTPVICVGESRPEEPLDAAAECVRQLEATLRDSHRAGVVGPAVVAYEPHWAIGAPSAAEPDYIRTVCRELGTALRADPALAGSRVIYGGSAGSGLLSQLADSVDGLFLGRASHDPGVLAAILDEATTLSPR